MNKPRKVSSLRNAMARLEAHRRKVEQAINLARIDTEILTVEGVAEYLHCSTAKVRTIPEAHLSRHLGPGRRLLYFKEDVHRYLRSNGGKRKGGVDDEMIGRAKARVLGSTTDSGRRRSRKKEIDQ